MGLIEAGENAIIGLFLAYVIGQITVNLFPSLQSVFNNNEVFGTTGAVTLGLIGFFALVFVIVVILSMIREARQGKQEFVRQFER